MRRLRALREEAGLTRQALAARAMIAPPRVGQMENGRVTPPPGSVELARLKKALHYKGHAWELMEDVPEGDGVYP
jgi:transcriptional regulator with XRE-family HTH domain